MRAGTHLGYLPTHYAERWVEQGEMRALLPDRLGYGITQSLVVRDEPGHNEALQALVEDLCLEHGAAPISAAR